MSRGHFDYDQDRITYVADAIEKLIEEDFRYDDDRGWCGEGVTSVDRLSGFTPTDRQVAIEYAKSTMLVLRQAKDMTDELDLLLSYDTGPETYMENMAKLCLRKPAPRILVDPTILSNTSHPDKFALSGFIDDEMMNGADCPVCNLPLNSPRPPSDGEIHCCCYACGAQIEKR